MDIHVDVLLIANLSSSPCVELERLNVSHNLISSVDGFSECSYSVKSPMLCLRHHYITDYHWLPCNSIHFHDYCIIDT